jgi:hypothetical protein
MAITHRNVCEVSLFGIGLRMPPSHMEGVLSSIDMIACPAVVNSSFGDFIAREWTGAVAYWDL